MGQQQRENKMTLEQTIIDIKKDFNKLNQKIDAAKKVHKEIDVVEYHRFNSGGEPKIKFQLI